MFYTFEVNPEVTALYESRSQGSEVLLFKRNEGLLGRINVPERGAAVEERLARSFENIRKSMELSAPPSPQLADADRSR